MRVADPAVAKDLLDALRAVGAEATRRDALTIVVTGGDEDLGTELTFFVRAFTADLVDAGDFQVEAA